jgi:hypothetical protein
MPKFKLFVFTIAAITGLVGFGLLIQLYKEVSVQPIVEFPQDNQGKLINENASTILENPPTQAAPSAQSQNITSVPTPPAPHQENQLNQNHEAKQDNSRSNTPIIWSFNGTSWSSNSTPPECPNPYIIQTPIDVNKVTAALWPGQVRGDYKGHGGFRFNDTDGANINVRAPVDSYLVQASQYLSGGDKQYLLFFSVPCGYFYRFDHIRTLPENLQEALKDLPPAIEGNSRTTRLNPPLFIRQGEIVGTSVGIFPSNIFVDFGLYDVRSPNNITPNPTWKNLFQQDIQFGHYGVCFFDYLPADHEQILKSLPTGKEGKTSDYCK